jgi:hypothetical protein
VCVCCDVCVIVAPPSDHYLLTHSIVFIVVATIVATCFFAAIVFFEFLVNHSTCRPIYYGIIFKLKMQVGAFSVVKYLNIKL